MHSSDSTLAAREGVVTLQNPSHVLIFAGISLIVAGLLGTAWLWLSEHRLPGLAGAAMRFAAVPIVGAGAAASIWVASLARDSAHGHTAAAADHAQVAVAAVPPPTGAVQAATSPEDHTGHPHPGGGAAAGADPAPMDEGSAHFHGAEVRVSEANLRAGLEFVDRVKAHVAQFEDVSSGLGAGYLQATQDLEGIAAHFVNLLYLADDHELDPERPEVLLYTKRLDGTWRLIGVMFQTRDTSEAPPSYFGGLDTWHYHTNLCFTAAGVRVVNAASDCRGVFTARTGWELHVWTEPGADGPFSHDYAPIKPGKFPPASLPAALEAGRVRRP